MYELVPGDVISDCIAFTGSYEDELSRYVRDAAIRGGRFVDVGANMGYFTLLWASANPANRVVAVEASPRNVRILKGNVARNHLGSRVEIIAKAAGRSGGILPFRLGPDEQTGWGGLAAPHDKGTIEVDVVRLDEILSAELPIDFLKIDIEGADTWALMGCESLIRARQVREIWFEENKPRMRELGIPVGLAQDFLRSCGYSVQAMSPERAEICEWRAVPA